MGTCLTRFKKGIKSERKKGRKVPFGSFPIRSSMPSNIKIKEGLRRKQGGFRRAIKERFKTVSSIPLPLRPSYAPISKPMVRLGLRTSGRGWFDQVFKERFKKKPRGFPLRTFPMRSITKPRCGAKGD
jgi:hypothetical protein